MLNLTSFGFASHFADELVSTDCVGHMYFQCDEIRLSSAWYSQDLSYFPEIKLQIHVMARLALDGVFSQKIDRKLLSTASFHPSVNIENSQFPFYVLVESKGFNECYKFSRYTLCKQL